MRRPPTDAPPLSHRCHSTHVRPAHSLASPQRSGHSPSPLCVCPPHPLLVGATPCGCPPCASPSPLGRGAAQRRGGFLRSRVPGTHPGPATSSGPPLQGGEQNTSPLGRGAAQRRGGFLFAPPGGFLGRTHALGHHRQLQQFHNRRNRCHNPERHQPELLV